MVTERLAAVHQKIEEAVRRSGRSDAPKLVAVSKTHPVATIARAYDEGQRVFGENRLQELEVKVPDLPDDIEWHLVGALQSRKARTASRVAAVLHGVDRLKLVERLDPAGADVLVQVNIAHEQQKAGASVDAVAPLVAALIDASVNVVGLMEIPPQPKVGEDSRRWFSDLRDLRDLLIRDWPTVRELSMGMTDDYDVAIEEGATIIRVGRAIFGARSTQLP
jgi:PLP dependent protein